MSLLRQVKATLPPVIYTLPKKNEGGVWLPQNDAIQHERIKMHGNDRYFLIVDYDVNGQEVVDHTHYDIEPNFLTYNPINSNHQAFWFLKDPVYAQTSTRTNAPYRYLKAIESAYDERYGGDKHFSRHVSRNPLAPFIFTDWRHDKKYSLKELAEVVTLNDKRIKSGSKQVGNSGRNCEVFEELRLWAYKQSTANISYKQYLTRVLTQAISFNVYTSPMALSEVQSIARSVAQYTYNKQHNGTFADYVAKTHTSEIQAERGKKSAAKRWANHVKQEPWLELGISKATYYRHKKANKL